MAETLTYDAGTDTVTTEENLNADEQDSLQVGEAMIEQQEQLLAGKYKNAQELEKAYVELQSKLGEKGSKDNETTSEAEVPEPEEVSKEKEEAPEASFLDTLWEEAVNNDKFSDETLKKLKETDSAELANQYLEYRKNNQPTRQDLTQKDVQELKGIVGGDKEYSNMLEWANGALNDQEIAMFDAVMERGDPLAAFFAVRSLAYRYEDAIGKEGRMLTGNAPKTSGDQFRSQAEVVKAMSDPRYDRDPAYRQDIMQKLERSNINF